MISEYFNLDPRIVFIVVVVSVLAVLIRLVKWLIANIRDDNDLDNNRDNDSDESEEKKSGRFFIILSYYLPDDWENTFNLIVDRQTKVQYLNYDSVITPLIDANGKPILYKDEEDQEESE